MKQTMLVVSVFVLNLYLSAVVAESKTAPEVKLNVRLQCDTRGDLPIDVIWMVDDEVYKFDPESRHETEKPDGKLSELVINDVDENHGTVYSCVAKNQHGNKTMQIKVDVPQPPSPLTVVAAMNYNGTVTIMWKTIDDDSTSQHLVLEYKTGEWEKPEKIALSSASGTVLLENLIPGTSYNARIKAKGESGKSGFSDEIVFRTKGRRQPPKNVRCSALSTQMIRVAWDQNRAEKDQDLLHKVSFTAAGGELLHPDKVKITSDASLVVRDLHVNTNYSIQVRVFNDSTNSDQSEPIFCKTADEVDAMTDLFLNEGVIKIGSGKDLILPCGTVHNPQNVEWKKSWVPLLANNHISVSDDGALVIKGIMLDDGGHYTCTPHHGNAEIAYIVLVLLPPSTPVVSVVSITKTSFTLKWKKPHHSGHSLQGYILSYRLDQETESTTKTLSPKDESFVLKDLRCGSTYYISLQAFDHVGVGRQSGAIKEGTVGCAAADDATAFPRQKSCPPDFDLLDGRCYNFNPHVTVSWHEARETCRNLFSGSDLVSIESEEEWKTIKSHLLKIDPTHNKAWWIGGTDEKEEGHWKWVANKHPFEFSNWCPVFGSDNVGGNENYAHIKDDIQHEWCWNDMTALHTAENYPIHFICEIHSM